MLKCADERNVCETKAYKVYGKMYQNHVDESYAVELVVGRHPEFPGSTGGKPPEFPMLLSKGFRVPLMCLYVSGDAFWGCWGFFSPGHLIFVVGSKRAR